MTAKQGIAWLQAAWKRLPRLRSALCLRLGYWAKTMSYPSATLSMSLKHSQAGVCPSSSRQITISPRT